MAVRLSDSCRFLLFLIVFLSLLTCKISRDLSGSCPESVLDGKLDFILASQTDYLLHSCMLNLSLSHCLSRQLPAGTVSPSLYNHGYCLLWARPTHGLPFRPRYRRSIYSMLTAVLLLLGGIESNPGPLTAPSHTAKPAVNFACYNARSAVSKVAPLHDLITDRQLDMLVLTETWITSNTPC